MGNSPLVSYTRISPNKTTPRNHKIDTITIHCVVGKCSVETLGTIFAPASRKASSNYGIGPDGRIGMYVEEKDRSWCSSNAVNDHRAITIEVASETTHPYSVPDAAYKSLIELLADICKRNGIKKLLWKGDKTLIGNISEQNMTVHRWFSNTACPGDYLYERQGEIAEKVNAKLSVSNDANKSFKVKITIPDLNIRTGPGTNYEKTGKFTGKGVFTITEVRAGKGSTIGWGHLKSGVGWISLDYATKV